MPKNNANKPLNQPAVSGSICRITKAQAESIFQAKEDLRSMLGGGDDDSAWKRHIRNIDKFLSNNGLRAN